MFNEPQVHAIMGHGLGEHAPGLYGRDAMAAACHHQNLAQGLGLAALREIGGSRFQLGTVFSLQPVRPAEGLAQVTIVGPDLALADGYATAALALGARAQSFLAQLGAQLVYLRNAQRTFAAAAATGSTAAIAR